MRRHLQYLCLVCASALLFFGPATESFTGLGLSDSLAQGNSENSPGHSGDGPGNSGNSPGHNGGTPSASTANGINSTSGPHALYASVKDDYGFKNFGEFSSYIKSWRSAWRNPQAYDATMGNLNSLPGRQYAYADAFVARQAALQAFTEAYPSVDPSTLPTLSDYNEALLALGSYNAQEVFDSGNPPELVNAANTVLTYEQYNPEWDAYQQAVASADTAFLATLPGNPTVIDPDLRDLVDQIVVQINLAGADAGLY